MWPCAVVSPEQREVEQEEGSEGREEGQDSPIACGDDIHLYDNQISPGPGQYTHTHTHTHTHTERESDKVCAGISKKLPSLSQHIQRATRHAVAFKLVLLQMSVAFSYFWNRTQKFDRTEILHVKSSVCCCTDLMSHFRFRVNLFLSGNVTHSLPGYQKG